MDEPTSQWRGCRALVTGCTGFLGGSVVRDLLGRGAEVVGLVRNRAADAEFTRHKLTGRVHIVRGRIEDTFRIHSALAIYEPRVVFHLATVDPNGPDEGVATILEAVRRYDPRVPIVVARHATEESRSISSRPDSPVPLGVARFGEIFGGGDRNIARIVPATIRGLLAGDRGYLPLGSRTRDFVSVADAARACLLLADTVVGRPGPQKLDIEFRSGWSMNDREMAGAIRDAYAGRAVPMPSSGPVANPLGWVPVANLTDAIAETIAWYRELARTRPFGTVALDPTYRAAA